MQIYNFFLFLVFERPAEEPHLQLCSQILPRRCFRGTDRDNNNRIFFPSSQSPYFEGRYLLSCGHLCPFGILRPSSQTGRLPKGHHQRGCVQKTNFVATKVRIKLKHV